MLPSRFESKIHNSKDATMIIDVSKSKSTPTQDKITEITTLVKKGHDINETDLLGYTALHWAAYTNEPDLVAGLIKLGAKVDAVSRCGETPLINAACSRNENTNKIVEILCQNRADINFSSSEGAPLYHAVDIKYGCRDEERARRFEIVSVLITHKANIDNFVIRKLVLRAFSRLDTTDLLIFKVLLKNGANPFAGKNLFGTPIDEIIQTQINYHPNIIPSLIDVFNSVELLQKRVAMFRNIIKTCNEAKHKDVNNLTQFKEAIIKVLNETISIAEVKQASRIMAQGYRDTKSIVSKLPQSIFFKIATYLPKHLDEKIACTTIMNAFCKPKIG